MPVFAATLLACCVSVFIFCTWDFVFVINRRRWYAQTTMLLLLLLLLSPSRGGDDPNARTGQVTQMRSACGARCEVACERGPWARVGTGKRKSKPQPRRLPFGAENGALIWGC